MKRRRPLILVALAVMVAVGLLAAQKPKSEGKLLLLDWAAKSSMDTPPVAVLVELGIKDTEPAKRNGKAVVSGAKVVHREGYRFRDGDKLTEPDGWEASSRRPIRVPRMQPAVAKTEGIDTIGVVLHLADLKDDAALTVERTGDEKEKEKVSLKEVLSGKPVTIFGGAARLRLLTTATPVATGKTEDDFPAACYGPDGTLWVAYVAYHVRDDDRRIEQKPLKGQPKDFKALDTPEFADQVMVKYNRGGKWSEPITITDDKQDIVRCAVTVGDDGKVWVAYGANRGKHSDISVRKLDPATPQEGKLPEPKIGAEEHIKADNGPNLNPVMCTDPTGRPALAWQAWADKASPGILAYFSEGGKWTGIDLLGGLWSKDNYCWHPAAAAGPDGQTAFAFDVCSDGGDYDVSLGILSKGGILRHHRIANSSRFEARPSLAYDPQGRLWIAYEEGPEQWGKDYGAFVADQGDPLYTSRSVRVVCLQDGKLFTPAAELPTSNARKPHPIAGGKPVPNFERTPRYSSPRLGIDGKGRLWLTYRQKFGTRYSTQPGSYWLTFARRLDGDHWSEPVEVAHSDGLLDSRPVVLPHKSGGIVIIHNTDGRYTTPETINNDIYLSYLNLPGEPVEPKLVPHDPGKKDEKLVARAKAEREAVERVRKYRVEADGKKYQLLRGEFHRHTELSWDGGPDGSLEDMFRYAIDAAAMDWIGNGDHDNGAGREYSWWLVQKFTDAYAVADHFTPMFSYERSVSYPHGHRNCVFARRGVRTLPRLAAGPDKPVAGVSPDDTKMLYRYLKELDGICASHTSATGMGTDWRDNDPQVEPLVEIYQGDRMNYEYEGAPRSGFDPKGEKKPFQIGGWEPKGFLDNALKEKGYRLGFESSSDHWSTHISFCVVLAEKHDRQGILDGLKKRHVYGATDDIILDVQSGTHLMGDEFKTNRAPSLDFHVIGTGPVARIDVLKDSEVVETIKPGKAEHKGTWTDPKPTGSVHYYYVRVQQEDGQLAWGSPMWIDFEK
jgi:hypothetical protein